MSDEELAERTDVVGVRALKREADRWHKEIATAKRWREFYASSEDAMDTQTSHARRKKIAHLKAKWEGKLEYAEMRLREINRKVASGVIG